MISAPTENERTVTGMDEYIEREALWRAFEHEQFYDNADRDEIVLPKIDSFKPADVAPVRHGRWVKSNYHGILCCSECKDVYIDKTWLGGGKWNYCPNCGAKMDLEGPNEAKESGQP